MEILGLVNIPIWVIILVLLLFLYYRYMTQNFGVFPSMGVKGPTPWPPMGNQLDFMRKGFNEATEERVKKYGKIYGIHEGMYPLLIIGDLDMLKDIMVKDFNNFPNRRDFGLAKMGKPPVTKFLTMLTDDDWRHNRNWLTPAFSGGKLKRMSGLISESGKTLVDVLYPKAESGEPINAKKYTGGFTMDVIAKTMFGIQLDSQRNPEDEFVDHSRRLNDFSLFDPKLIFMVFFPFLNFLWGKIGISIFDPKSVEFFTVVTEKLLSERRQQPGTHKDFLQTLINAESEAQSASSHDDTSEESKEANKEMGDKYDGYWKDKRKGDGLTDGEIVAAVMTFFVAGYETTSTNLAHVLYYLALNPDCTNKLIREVDEHYPNEAVPDYDGVSQLVYMDNVICETLRMIPPLARTDRVCTSETTVGGIQIPKDMGVGIPIYSIHHDPDFWPNPEKFDPERFTPEQRAKHHPLQWLPFGYGPRNCIGMRLALVEMKILLVQLFQKYRFVPNEKTEIPLKFNDTVFLTTKERGVWLTVQNR